MSEHDAPEQGTTAESTETRVPERSVRRRRRWPWILGAVLLTPILVLVLWITIALNYSYSKGSRAGFVQKFSKKGWVCKTWEGELAQANFPGSVQQRWEFSVRDDSIARLIENAEGKQVQLTYAQHKGIPSSCFGETEYFVTGVRVLGP